MINLLYTINGLRVNGMSAVIMQYISMLNLKEYHISILTDEIAPQFVSELEKCNVHVLTTEKRRKNPFAYYQELKSVLKNNKFDVIHAHGNSATIAVEMMAAKKCGIPVRIAHSHNTTCIHKNFDKLLRPLFYSTYTHGIGCGVEAGKWLFANHPHVVIKNGIDLEKYKFDEHNRNKIRTELDIKEKNVIGHIGRFTDQKNHPYMIEVFEKYRKKDPDAVLLLVGDGPHENSIKELVKNKGLSDNVIFYGTTSNTSEMYSAMDLFLFPSKFEGVPLTLVEAQANGLHCLISDKISQEVIQTDLITVLSLNSIDDWVNKIQLSSEDRFGQSEKAVNALKKSGFDIHGVIKTLDELYKSTLITEDKS